MMNSEVPGHTDNEPGPFAGAKRAVIATGGSMVILVLMSIATGYAVAALDHGMPTPTDFAVIGTIALLALLSTWLLWRFLSKQDLEPEAPRIQRARKLFVAMAIIGGVLGILLAVGNDGGLQVFSNGPINPLIALVTGVIFLVIVPVATWIWWKSIDEHEANAYRDGSMVAVHAYFFIVPTWWLAARAGYVPAQDPMVVLMIVSVIWGAAWFVRRYL